MENRELKFLEMEKEVNRRGGDGAAVVEAYREPVRAFSEKVKPYELYK